MLDKFDELNELLDKFDELKDEFDVLDELNNKFAFLIGSFFTLAGIKRGHERVRISARSNNRLRS